MNCPEHASAQLVSKKAAEGRLDRHVHSHPLERRTDNALASRRGERFLRLSREAIQPVGNFNGCDAWFWRPGQEALCEAIDGLKDLGVKTLDGAKARRFGCIVIGQSQFLPDDR